MAIGFTQLLIVLAIALIVLRTRSTAAKQQHGERTSARSPTQTLPWWQSPLRVILVLLVAVIVVTNAVALWMKWG